MDPRPPNARATPHAPGELAAPGDTTSPGHTEVGQSSSRSGLTPPRQPGELGWLGRFRVLEELGHGGMGAVFRAEDTQLKREIALKVLSPELAADPQAKARFQREAQAQAKVEHDHVTTIFDVGEANGLPFIAMPLLKGRTLDAALKQNARPPVAELVRIGRETAEGLAAAHAAGLIHRDIKPGNVWLEGSKRRVKILDFGLARRDSNVATGTSEPLTVLGAVVGTPAYMSPEQARGLPVDHRTDLFSLGVVLYQMATGHKPFTGAHALAIMCAVIEDDPPAAHAVAPELPPALGELILRLMAKDPAGRPRGAAEVAEALAEIERGLIVPPVQVIPLASVVDEFAQPDPWADLETTQAEPVKRKPAKPERRDSFARRGAPKRINWLWPVVGVAGAAALAGAVWLAVALFGGQPKPETAAPPTQPSGKQPTPPPKKEIDHERVAAEQLGERARLTLRLAGGGVAEIKPGDPLPAEKFAITEIAFGNENLPPNYTGDTLLPALASLKSVARVRLNHWQLDLSADQLRALAAMPVAATLEQFDARIEVTHKSFNDLKKLKNLSDLSAEVRTPDDALFARLAEIPKLNYLTLFSIPAREGLTAKGWQAIADLPLLETLVLYECGAIKEAFPLVTAEGGPKSVELIGSPLSDAALLELSQRTTDLVFLRLSGTGVTDSGVLHLAKVPSLREVRLSGGKLTEKGAKALKDARPALIVRWDTKPVEATPQP